MPLCKGAQRGDVELGGGRRRRGLPGSIPASTGSALGSLGLLTKHVTAQATRLKPIMAQKTLSWGHEQAFSVWQPREEELLLQGKVDRSSWARLSTTAVLQSHTLGAAISFVVQHISFGVTARGGKIQPLESISCITARTGATCHPVPVLVEDKGQSTSRQRGPCRD